MLTEFRVRVYEIETSFAIYIYMKDLNTVSFYNKK